MSNRWIMVRYSTGTLEEAKVSLTDAAAWS